MPPRQTEIWSQDCNGLRKYQRAPRQCWCPSLKFNAKLCHPDRSAAKQAEWRDLLLRTTWVLVAICSAANIRLSALAADQFQPVPERIVKRGSASPQEYPLARSLQFQSFVTAAPEPHSHDNANLGAPSSRDGSHSRLQDQSAPRRSQTSIRRAWRVLVASVLLSFPIDLHKTRGLSLPRREASRVEHDRWRLRNFRSHRYAN
jgi:hypothetical protein